MPLIVLSVAYPLARVGSDSVGGAEQVLSLLDRALVSAGHHSIVIAMEGSTIAGTLIPTPRWDGPLTPEIQAAAQLQVRKAIDRALKSYAVDLVHLHGVDFPSYLPATEIPAVATLHLPPHLYPQTIFGPGRPGLHLICVSESQRQACPERTPPWLVIPNGVDVQTFQYSAAKDDYALVLSRVCPEKGLHCALRAADLAQMPLIIAGAVYEYPEHRVYFESEIQPRLSTMARFIGSANFEQKRKLLSGARCLLVPSLIDETSSLVTMEAMASGTPVIAFGRGALNQLIQHGRTGFLVGSVEEMAEAIRSARKIDPAICRAYAIRHFSADDCVQKYFALYQRIARRGSLASVSPGHPSAEVGEQTNVDGRAGVVRADAT